MKVRENTDSMHATKNQTNIQQTPPPTTQQKKKRTNQDAKHSRLLHFGGVCTHQQNSKGPSNDDELSLAEVPLKIMRFLLCHISRHILKHFVSLAQGKGFHTCQNAGLLRELL